MFLCIYLSIYCIRLDPGWTFWPFTLHFFRVDARVGFRNIGQINLPGQFHNLNVVSGFSYVTKIIIFNDDCLMLVSMNLFAQAYLLFGDEEYLFMFQEAYRAAMHYLYNDPWWVNTFSGCYNLVNFRLIPLLFFLHFSHLIHIYNIQMMLLFTFRYVEVNMNSAALVWPLFNSLQAFWPGLQVIIINILCRFRHV